MALTAGKFWGMRRMADPQGRFKMVAVDQRPPIKGPIAKARGTTEAPYEDVERFKLKLIDVLQAEASAMLLDPHYALPKGLGVLLPAKGLVVTLEDSLFEETEGGRLSNEIDHWSVEKIKRVGGDAVKVLAWYRPDASADVALAQQDFAKRIGEACARYDIPYVFELLVYELPGEGTETGYVEMAGKKAELVLDSVSEFAHSDYGIDLFKLESPMNAAAVPGVGADGWREAQALFDEMGVRAGRPWVMLSAGAGTREFRNVLTHAYQAGASGYLAGRAIWLEAFRQFPDWDAIRSQLQRDAIPYMRELNALTDVHARPWHAHERHADVGFPEGAAFREGYPGFGDAG